MMAVDDNGDPSQAKRTIEVMSIPRFDKLYKNFYQWMGRDPEEHEEPSREQLSLVEDTFDNGSSYLDYA